MPFFSTNQTMPSSIWYLTIPTQSLTMSSTVNPITWTNTMTGTTSWSAHQYNSLAQLQQMAHMQQYQGALQAQALHLQQQIERQIARPHVRSSHTQADIKARDLLIRSLTPEQRASLE